MNFIKKIQEAESIAKSKIEDAQKESELIILNAKKEKESKLKEVEDVLKKEYDDRLKLQRSEMAILYKNIIVNGKKEVDQIKNRADKSKDKAVDFVVNKIISSI